jgi:PKD repeat protein
MSSHATRPPVPKSVLRRAARVAVWVALPLVCLSRAHANPPEFVFSTFLGGVDGEQLAAVACDAAGNPYVAGAAHQNSPPLARMLAAKYSIDGALLWSCRIDFADRLGVVTGVAVTPDGRLCVVGSALPPPPGQPIQRLGPGGDLEGLIVLLSADGTVETTTYLGGSSADEIDGVAIAPDGSIVVVGTTYSRDFPTSHPFQATLAGGRDGFVAVLSPDASSVISSSYLGGSADDPTTGVAIDGQGAIWVAGSTASDDFPFQRSLIGTHACGTSGGAFVAKVAPGARAVEFSTLLCGSRGSWANALAVDATGNAYVVGGTYAPDFPTTPGALKTSISGSGTTDAFVTAVASAGDRLLFSTYLGGSGGMSSGPGGFGREEADGVAVDASGRVFVAGVTSSDDFPLVQPLQAQLANSLLGDAFLSVLDATGSRLEFSTYLGGSDIDSGNAVAVPAFGRVVVAGATGSSDFPVIHAAQPTYGGGNSDGFVTGIALSPAPLSASATAAPASGPSPLAVAFQGVPSGGVPPYTFDWDFGDGSPHSSQQNPTHTYTLGGDYTAVLKVTDSGGATASASVGISVAHNCSLACGASVPAVVPVGQAAAFSASSTPYDCAGSVSYQWAFGDGQGSAEQTPSHTYASPGLYAWSLVATIGPVSCSRSGTIAVASAPVNASYLLAAVAHNPGYLGTQWRSEVAVVNLLTSPATAHLTLVFHGTTGSSLFATAEVPAGGSLAWRDILVSLFGQPQEASIQGALLVYADRPVALTVRTYDQTDNGTLGSSYPALVVGDGVGVGQTGVVPGLKRNAGFRSNLGAVNVGDVPCTVVVTLYDAQGTQLGAPRSLDLAPGAWSQLNDVLSTVGTIDLAYATVVVPTANGRAWAYGSVVDNASGDPTTIPVAVP